MTFFSICCFHHQAHKLTYTQIEEMYPKIDKFREICHQLDPQGLFRNEYLERVIFGPPHQSKNAENAATFVSTIKLNDRSSVSPATSPGF